MGVNLLLLSINAVHGDCVVDKVPCGEGAVTVGVPVDTCRVVAHGVGEAMAQSTGARKLQEKKHENMVHQDDSELHRKKFNSRHTVY